MQSTQAAIRQQLEDNQRELLDLSNRNRLISMPIGSKNARIVQIFDELAVETFKKLIKEKKAFTFLPGQITKGKAPEPNGLHSPEGEDQEENPVEIPLPDEDEIEATTGLAKRHTDLKLQTSLSPEALQRRLFDLYNESRTLIEEQGVNILYLAIGFLHWVDKTNGNTERTAPLLLIPVDLIRKSAAERFAIKWREEDLQENLSLAEKFRIELGLTLPTLSIDDPESFDLLDYFAKVQQSIASMPGWKVEADGMCLGFFSFAKFLMYRDLDASAWPADKSIVDHPLIRQLLLTNQAEEGLADVTIPPIDAERLDEAISTERLDHIVDADSSQTIAIELVRTGRNLVIQGPPGTGKSQTITNIIATAVLDGKKVLFVAEKLAALEVVKRRLEKEHLGVLCLELHSNKARKADIAQDLKATWDLGKPAPGSLQFLNIDLEKHRTVLNKHPQQLHKPLALLQHSAFDFIGILATNGRPEGRELGIIFAGAENWNEEQIRLYREQLKELQLRLTTVGDLSQHPWRGVRQTTYFGTERQLFFEKIQEWTQQTQALQRVTSTIQTQLQLPAAELSVRHIQKLNRLAAWASVHPVEKLPSVGQSIWDEAGTTILAIAKNKAVYEMVVAETKGQVLSSIWKGNAASIRQQLVLHGQKWYKFIIGSYRKAMAQLQTELSVPLVKSYEEKLALVDTILKGQQAWEFIQAKDKLAREAFGTLWELDDKAARLVAIAEWVQQGAEEAFTAAERQAAYEADRSSMLALIEEHARHLQAYHTSQAFFENKLKIDWTAYTAHKNGPENLTLSQGLALQESWLAHLDSVSDWVAYEKQLGICTHGPIAPLALLAKQGMIPANHLLVAFNRIWAHQCLEQVFKQEDSLASFDGAIHENRVEQFKQLDTQRLHLAKVKVLDAHYVNIPEKRPVGMVGTVLAEANKQRNHKPIRKLLKEAGTVVQNLKPVFMMSPLSVAQYLEPGAIEFDILVIDEASQVHPVDALGAVARAKQIIVVGDDKQLPPTMFFSKMTSNNESINEEDEVEEGQVKAKELESILSLCNARGFHSTLLRWHYRSRHESLIAISNKRYYENKLFIVPSPWKENAGLGLKWRPINGIYDRANTRSNPIEAKEVALAVLNHARHHSDKTLGVAGFSMSQQRAIQDEVEILRRKFPAEMESFFAQYPHEPFFVKNLENVQGDERDVIFLSVGYGKDAQGKMYQNFGPLNKVGGERRLNVLISRARKCCEVFCSITEQDIVTTEASREGVIGLKHFLQYARTGIFDIAQAHDNQRPKVELLALALKTAIEKRFGWEVQTQVGIAGFFIDLAIIDPERRGRYVLGIEIDGMAYHGSPSSRDRDRLRPTLLESQGWFIHRLWSVDFFRRPDQELNKIKAAYEEALDWLKEAESLEIVKPAEEQNVFFLQREQEEKAEFTVPYLVAKGIAIPNQDPYALFPAQLAEIIHQILLIEAPIHLDELVTRMREQWGWSRAAERFRNHVGEGLTVLINRQTAAIEANFISLPEKALLKVRKRADDSPVGTRKSANIPPSEIDLALKQVTDMAHSLSREEAAKEVSIALGFRSLSSDFRSIIEDRINWLLKHGQLIEVGGKLTV
jgi:very-short-patch-repair endonuclease